MQGPDGRCPEILPASESAGLLDCAVSEASYDDKLSLSSASTTATTSTGTGGGSDAATALLKAAYVKDEYRGGWVGGFMDVCVRMHAVPSMLTPLRIQWHCGRQKQLEHVFRLC